MDYVFICIPCGNRSCVNPGEEKVADFFGGREGEIADLFDGREEEVHVAGLSSGWEGEAAGIYLQGQAEQDAP